MNGENKFFQWAQLGLTAVILIILLVNSSLAIGAPFNEDASSEATVNRGDLKVTGNLHTQGTTTDQLAVTARGATTTDTPNAASNLIPVFNKVSVGECTDASATIFGVKNPLAAAARARLVHLAGTNGTTTVDLTVGTSSTSTGTPTESLLDEVVVNASGAFYLASQNLATSTGFKAFSTDQKVLYDNTGAGATTTVDALNGGADNRIASNEWVYVGANDFIVGLAKGQVGNADTGGVTNAVNTFSCRYGIEWER